MKFEIGQRVKIIAGAPCKTHEHTEDIGKVGEILDILLWDWINPKFGFGGYLVWPEGGHPLYYPSCALELIGE